MIDKELFKLLGNNKKYIFFVVFLMILGLLFNIGITASICGGIYILYQNLELINFLYVALGLLISIVGRLIITISTGKIKDKLGRDVKKEIRDKAYKKILSLGTRSQGDIKIAGLSQICIEGVEQLDLYYSTYLPQFFYSMIAPIILFIVNVFISWQVSLVLLCCVPLIPISIIAVSKYAKRVFAKYRGKYISMGDSFLDCIQGLKELKIYKADGIYSQKMHDKSEEFRKITMKVLIMQLASTTIMDLVAFCGAGVGIGLTIYLVVNTHLNPILGLFLILIAVEFFLPLRALGSAFHVAMNGVSAGKKLSELLGIDDVKWGKEQVDSTKITIKDVSYKYSDSNSLTLKHINMEFEPGKFTAIVGPSGCGKSTIVSLITGENIVTNGEILIGNKPIFTYSRNSYYSKIVLVSSSTYIFNDTIRNNFLIANEDVSDDEIIEAIKKVNLEKILNGNGLENVINEDSTNISGGERQRLALAINLIRPKEIYIFDEATSNIDVESEAIIMENILEISKKHSVILISHRLENVKNADKIYYLEFGEILESGTHQELMKLNGEYSKLYLTQKELENGYKFTDEEVKYAN